MRASGFAFPEARWEGIKRQALRDMRDYVASDRERREMLGDSPFKNFKVHFLPI